MSVVQPLLFEGQSDPLFTPPNDVAEPALTAHAESEAVGKPQRSIYFASCTGCRYIADEARNDAAAELNSPGLVDAMTLGSALFGHRERSR
jgi:hypothetical protein